MLLCAAQLRNVFSAPRGELHLLEHVGTQQNTFDLPIGVEARRERGGVCCR